LARRKSVAFANANSLYVQQHPDMTWLRLIDGHPGRTAMANQTKEDIEIKLPGHRQLRLIYFYSPVPVLRGTDADLKFFSDKYNWEYSL